MKENSEKKVWQGEKEESDTLVESKALYKRLHVGIIEKDGHIKDTVNFKCEQMEQSCHPER